MNKIDNRLVCSDEKKNKIKMTKKQTQLRRQNQIVKTYECKIVEKRLNKKQHEELDMLFLEGKWFYNHVLNLKKSNGKKLQDINSTKISEVSHFDKDKNQITSKLENLSSQQKQAIVQRMISNERTIMSLVKNKFQKHGQLQFKSELNCIPLKQYGNSYVFKSFNKVRISGISGKLLVKTGGQLQDVDELANANLIRKPDGYYLKITTYTHKDKIKKQISNNKEIGLDFGIKTNITTSEGEKIDVSVEERDRLKMLQKKLSRQVKGSNNRYKTINSIRREYQKITNRKNDKANKIVSKLKKYKTVYIQDENISGWHKGLFGKQIQHSCLGIIKDKLLKQQNVVILDRFIPTSKFCPECHSLKNDLTLSDRIYSCSCGHKEDRDIHAARNMIEIAHLVFENKNLVPTEHREITLVQFKTSVDVSDDVDKSGC